jgi:hypothetical protein
MHYHLSLWTDGFVVIKKADQVRKAFCVDSNEVADMNRRARLCLSSGRPLYTECRRRGLGFILFPGIKIKVCLPFGLEVWSLITYADLVVLSLGPPKMLRMPPICRMTPTQLISLELGIHTLRI